MRKVLFGLLMVISIFSGCSKNEPEIRVSAEEFKDLSYGQSSSQKVDVYLPAGRGADTKMIILLHGGAWYEGDKASLSEVAKYLRSKGYACANINYRLTNTAGNIHPAQVNDVEAAIEFIENNASDWQIAQGKMALIGTSAGAHIGLLYAYQKSDDRVKAVVSVAGPTDLTDTRRVNQQTAMAVERLLGTTYQSNPEIYRDASPVTHVKTGSSPTLIFHGGQDAVVPIEQAQALKSKLDQFGVINKLIIYPESGHEVLDNSKVPAFLQEVEGWLITHLK